ncbi:hypothetical protein EI693_23335 [Pseudomonas oryziphila]|uniref:DUF1534 domain-containing protein n=1 Tax=Pseudomonas oryziphila TaxID=2894079 RepID=A0ABM7CWG9_9PSED|nr:hypothetical protein EI693_23335 [Pseudomonas oryziphila]
MAPIPLSVGAALCRERGRVAAPGFQLRSRNCWGRSAALSRHKAAPTQGPGSARYLFSGGSGACR